jgi:S1-C subfamily serine protease
MYTTEVSDHLVVNGIARSGPADGAGIRLGDIVVEVGDERVGSLAEMYRKVWRRGPPGTVVPLTVVRSGTILRIDLRSADRADFLRKPRLQ